MEKQFKIENLDEKQARIIVEALDLYSRLMMGQVEELIHFFRMHCSHETDRSYQQIEAVVKELKAVVFPGMPMNGSHGIANEKVPDESKISFDMLKAIRRCLAYARKPEGGMTVDFDPLSFAYGSKPFIKVSEDEKKA